MADRAQHPRTAVDHLQYPAAHDVERRGQTPDFRRTFRSERFLQIVVHTRLLGSRGETGNGAGDQPTAEIGQKSNRDDDLQNPTRHGR